MTISNSVWDNYIAGLRKVSETASQRFLRYLTEHPPVDQQAVNQLIEYAFSLATKYGEAAAELSAQMYDAVAALSGVVLDPAVPAATATMSEAAQAVVGTLKTGNDEIVSGAVGRLVKMAGVDTTMQNAIRDGAQWAWIPRGDTCAFCIALGANGWQRASRAQIKGGHAEHIHANCDCTFAVRFNADTDVAGYKPEVYRAMYDGAEGNSAQERINSMRRTFYAENKARLERQGLSEDAKRIALNQPAAEQYNVK